MEEGGGGGGDGRKPATSSSPSSRRQKPRASREFCPERSLESQKEGPCSSSPSVSSKNSLLQMVTPVPAKSLDSPVQPPKFLDSPLQTIKQVQPPKSQDSLVQMAASIQVSKPLDSSSASCSSGTVGSDLGAAPFDICMGNSKGLFKLSRPLHEINKEKRLRVKELSNSAAPLQHLRPGMVLLKNFLKPDDQVKIIKLCRELGVGPGGFYQPVYREGAKLSLRMMCLGKNWDPDSCSYGDIRTFDDAQPPKIPEELTKYVKYAIEASHEFLKQRGKGATNPAVELPLTSPDICIVKFYTTSGKLGLHQDENEEKSSLAKGLPVVSFSLGDTAEFLYGDVRDDDKASKIKLESGDVLIFGGQSRHIFHGVSSIAPKSAPLWVTDKANLRPGRLNLTFRQYSYNGSTNVTPAPANVTPAPFDTNLRPGGLNLTPRQYKESLSVTPAPFDTCVCDNNAAPLQHLRPGMVLLKKFLKANDQDTDVTETSFARELPVVSFWLGDSAEFLYRGIRDDVASKIDLESGDVLIFGGQSRLISHAVSSIKPRTAPKGLADKTNLQAFRQY